MLITFIFSPRPRVSSEHNRRHLSHVGRHGGGHVRALHTVLRAANAVQFRVLVPAHLQGVPERFLVQLHGLLLHIPVPNRHHGYTEHWV